MSITYAIIDTKEAQSKHKKCFNLFTQLNVCNITQSVFANMQNLVLGALRSMFMIHDSFVCFSLYLISKKNW